MPGGRICPAQCLEKMKTRLGWRAMLLKKPPRVSRGEGATVRGCVLASLLPDRVGCDSSGVEDLQQEQG